MDEEDLDRIAGRLGAAAPFEVDWDAYAAQVIGRIARSERQRRRRGWWVTLAGTLAGAAAAWLVAVLMIEGRHTRPTPEPQVRVAVSSEQDRAGPVATPVSSVEEPSVLFCVRKPGTPYALRSTRTVGAFSQPFVQRLATEEGRVSEIRFYGFTPEGVERPGLIVIGEEGRRLPEHSNTGL